MITSFVSAMPGRSACKRFPARWDFWGVSSLASTTSPWRIGRSKLGPTLAVLADREWLQPAPSGFDSLGKLRLHAQDADGFQAVGERSCATWVE